MADDAAWIAGAAELLESALDGKAVVRRLPLVGRRGMPVRLETRWGACIDFRLVPWKGERLPRAPGRIRRPGALPRVWVLRRGSRRLRQALRDAGVSFVELSGVVHLDLPGLLVDRADLRPIERPRSRRRLIDPFADRSSLVCRVLLTSKSDRAWGVRELAEAAGVNPSTASRVVRELAGAGLVEFERIGRASRVRVPDPLRLLEGWTDAYDWGSNRLIAFDAPIGDPPKFLARLRRVLGGTGWALTLHAGASLVAPHAAWERVHLYVDGDESAARRLARAAGWRRDDEGALVVMLPRYKQSVWWRVERKRGLPVVSALQLVLDLWHYPLRGREQAEQLLETRLEPIWRG
jgi:hypothetical protein